MDHTAKRISQVETIKESIIKTQETCFELISKNSCDGTSGLYQYNQKFTHPDNNVSDNSVTIFMICIVQISLKFIQGSIVIEVWKNQRSSSTMYCRMLRFAYQKESTENIKLELANIEEQIQGLEPTKINVKGIDIQIKHSLLCTMIDGRVRQVITKTISTQRCCIYGAPPKEMNNLDVILKKDVNLGAYQYGLSTLHAWIRCMEWILHIAFKLPVQKWNVQLTEEGKKLVAKNRERIQTEIRCRVGVLVDCVKQGADNTNDGNTARRFFTNCDVISEITGVSKQLIKNLYIILQAISSKSNIDIDKFEKFCLETCRMYVQDYSWYAMPSSCHMLLIQGGTIIRSLLVPIGQLSEEAQEARNKDFKRCRESYTRKSSPVKTNEGIIHHLLVTSDPYLASLRKIHPDKMKELLPETQNLLQKDGQIESNE